MDRARVFEDTRETCDASREVPSTETLAVRPRRREAVTERSIPVAVPSSSGLATPLLPPPATPPTESRATLTVLTGMHAGRLVAIGSMPMTIGRAADADLITEDAGLSRYHARISRGPGGAFYAEDLGSTNGTFFRTRRLDVALLHGGDVLRLGPTLLVRFAILDSIEERLHRQLYESAVRDPLTHTFNRKYLGDRLLCEVSRARRGGSELVLFMIDVDCLKELNDRYGHLAGDRAIRTIAKRVQSTLRVEDILARYGGDEFVVAVVGASRADAALLAERVRRAVADLQMGARGREVRVTASVGVASLAELPPSDDPVTALIALADARVYRAKASGRNCVCAEGAEASPYRHETERPREAVAIRTDERRE